MSKKIEAALYYYKKQIKKMIEKLNSYLAEAPLHRDNLDFLSAIKSEVENLIRSVDKFTMGLTQDPSFSTSKQLQKSGTKRRTSKGFKKLKTEGNDSSPLPFQADTFNSKFKRHVQYTEKHLLDSNSKANTHSKSKRQTEKKDIFVDSKKTKAKLSSKGDFIDRSALANKSWDSVKPEECSSCSKVVMDLKTEVKQLKKEQGGQAILIENLQLELSRLKKQNAILVQHLGINARIFED